MFEEYKKKYTDSIENCIDNFDEAFLICKIDPEFPYSGSFSNEDKYIYADILTADSYLGGEGMEGYTDNSNVHFETSKEAQIYYSRKYSEILVFDDENERNEIFDELTGEKNQ